MTDTAIKTALINRFLTLNTFSGIDFTTASNVAKPNEAFNQPTDNRWFQLHFIPNEPEQIAIGVSNYERWTGLFQIDICTPLDRGELEADTKYEWIAKLFARGTSFSNVIVERVYSPDCDVEKDHYKKIVRVEWTADIDNSL